MLATGLCLATASCVDDIKFGSSFLEKAPGADVTVDTVFNNAEYTRQFLVGVYARQYYGLPYSNKQNTVVPCDPYVGKNQLMTDCWQNIFTSSQISSQYYAGKLTSGYGLRGCTFEYLRSNVWTAVRAAWQLIENIDKTPGMDTQEKKQMVAEAKCLIAARYFDTFRFYGGLPIVKSSFKFDGSSYTIPRGTVDETVKFMIQLLDEAIPDLQWNYNEAEKKNDLGRWTSAGAMALKCKILLFAASPLFNAAEPYSTETSADATDKDQNLCWWYGGYDARRWDDCREACKELLDEIDKHGNDYYLEQAKAIENKGKSLTINDYRVAFRTAYFRRESHEVLHSVRVTGYDNFKSGDYVWHSWGAISGIGGAGRLAFNPTAEYVDMFPWADGTPMPAWDNMTKEQKDSMFTKGVPENGDKDFHYTRDPRLYETVLVPGMYHSLNWETHTNQAGDNKNPQRLELWIGSKNGSTDSETETGSFGTGFANNKYYLSPTGQDALRQYTQWVYIRLAEIYLTYAEAILQSGGSIKDALKWIDPIRNRVGLKNLETANPSAVSSKDALIEELLKERVRELGMEDTRWFDIVRYKKGDLLTKPLHGLRIYRLDDKGNDNNKMWYGTNDPYPTNFRYERFEFKNITRTWWNQSFDPKWYLQPFPKSEIEKRYGMIQNPGW